MSLKQIGDGFVKYWAIILFVLGGMTWATLVYADTLQTKADVNRLQGKYDETTRDLVFIKFYLVRIGEKLGVRYDP